MDAIRELAPTGTLRAAIAVGPAGSALWATRDPVTDEPRGVTVDLARALAALLGLPLELVEHASSGQIIETAAAGRWDVTFTPVDDERRRQVDFGPAYYVGESTYLVPAGSAAADVADVDRPGVRVVGVENTATIRSARRSLTRTEAVGVTGLDEALALFRDGAVDALALGRESLLSLVADLPGARILPGAFHSAGTAIAVPKGRPAALAAVSDFIRTAKADGTVRAAFDSHGMRDASVAPPSA